MGTDINLECDNEIYNAGEKLDFQFVVDFLDGELRAGVSQVEENTTLPFLFPNLSWAYHERNRDDLEIAEWDQTEGGVSVWLDEEEYWEAIGFNFLSERSLRRFEQAAYYYIFGESDLNPAPLSCDLQGFYNLLSPVLGPRLEVKGRKRETRQCQGSPCARRM